jgi:hypothetical protein
VYGSIHELKSHNSKAAKVEKGPKEDRKSPKMASPKRGFYGFSRFSVLKTLTWKGRMFRMGLRPSTDFIPLYFVWPGGEYLSTHPEEDHSPHIEEEQQRDGRILPTAG